MTFRGAAVKTVTLTKWAFWNAGTKTIDGRDVPERDPILLHIQDGRVLNAKIVHLSSPAIGLEAEERGDASIMLRFDYLDHGDGGVVQVVHTGRGKKAVEVRGSVKGGGKVSEFVPRREIAFGLVMTAFGFLAIIVGLVTSIVNGVGNLRAFFWWSTLVAVGFLSLAWLTMHRLSNRDSYAPRGVRLINGPGLRMWRVSTPGHRHQQRLNRVSQVRILPGPLRPRRRGLPGARWTSGRSTCRPRRSAPAGTVALAEGWARWTDTLGQAPSEDATRGIATLSHPGASASPSGCDERRG
jgi:hypothetical protein